MPPQAAKIRGSSAALGGPGAAHGHGGRGKGRGKHRRKHRGRRK